MLDLLFHFLVFLLLFLRWTFPCLHLQLSGFANALPSVLPLSVETHAGSTPKISQWQQQHWEPVNNQRIYMHGVTNNAELSAKHSCAVESSARNNVNRSIQIFMRMPSSYRQPMQVTEFEILRKNCTWCSVLRHYRNLEIIFFQEREYFRDTALIGWYSDGKWRKSPHQDSHISGYSKIVSLFKGGGLFVELDTLVTLKPLAPWKWWNFFVKNDETSRPAYGVVPMMTSDIFHLTYGHHLSDDIILTLGQAVYNPLSSANEILTSALHDSVTNICIGHNHTNHCQDIQVFDGRDVFLPEFDSAVWQRVRKALEYNNAPKKSKISDQALTSMIKNTVNANRASLMKWKSYPHLKGKNGSVHKTLHFLLLSQNCPHTLKYFSNEF